jgi:hypothetical protein
MEIPKMKLLLIPIGAALLTAGTAATAQSVSNESCILVSNAFANGSKDANAQKLAQATFYFYLGRLPEGTSAAQLKSQFDAVSKTLTNANAGNVMNSCAKSLVAKEQLLQSLAPPPSQQNAPAQQPQKKTQPQGR